MEEFIRKYSGDNVWLFIKENNYLNSGRPLVVSTGEPLNIISAGKKDYDTLVDLKRVNKIKDVDAFFCAVNGVLKPDGIFICTAETMGQRKERDRKSVV